MVHPSGAVSLADAHAAIELWEHYSYKRLDPEQRLAVEHMMATRSGGMWAARSTGRAASRQNGKGDELEVVEAWDLLKRGAPVMHTAHEFKTAKKAHARLLGFLHSHADLRVKVRRAYASSMSLSIETWNGGIVEYSTRTAGGGRGLDDIARLIVDEAQWAQPEQLAASTPILAVNPNPQMNFTGSAGVEGRSAWWWGLRKRALAGDGDGFGWLEHSAEQVSLIGGEVLSIAPNPYDRAMWARANFGYPERISEEFLAEQLGILGPELFAREHLNVWDPDDGDGTGVAFGPGKWEACFGLRPKDLKPAALSVAVSFELTHGAIGSAAIRDGITYVKPLHHAPGTAWIPSKAKALQDTYGVDVVIDGHGPAAPLIDDLTEAGVTLKVAETSDVLDSCADLYTLVDDGHVRHESYPELGAAVKAAVKRPVGDRWAWGRRVSTADISPLEAVTLAAWWANHASFMPAIF